MSPQKEGIFKVYPSVPRNMTFFGSRVIAVYKIRSYWGREFLIQYDLCSYRRHRKERWPHIDRDIKGECHMRMETEVGITPF